MPRSPRVPRTYDLGFEVEPTPAPPISPLFASATGAAPPPGEIGLDRLLNNPYQPDDRGDAEAVAELAAVIERQGFHGKLLGRPAPGRPGYYELAFGHQRREAARQAGLVSVPVELQDLTNREMAEQIVTENIHRQDLSAYQEAQTYRVMKTALGMTDAEIARAVGKGRLYVTKRLGLLRAPADVQSLVREVPESFSAAEQLKQIDDSALREELIAGFRAGNLTTHDIAEARRTGLSMPVTPAPANAVPRPVTPAGRHEVDSPPDADEQAARSGLLKLNTAAESLLRWGRQAQQRPVAVSAREYAKLCEIRTQVAALISAHRPLDSEPDV